MSSKPRGNPPAKQYIELLGRNEDLNELRRLLSLNVRLFCLSIIGMGGIGKTALATEIAHHFMYEYETIPEQDRFDYIIWTSAKFEDYAPTGRQYRDRRNIQSTLLEIYRVIAAQMQLTEIKTADPDTQTEIIIDALNRHRALLIIDNYETITDDTAIREFLLSLSTSQTNVLITSRLEEPLRGIPHQPLYLSGLGHDVARSFIRNFMDASPEIQLDKLKIENLIESSHGIPLVLSWALQNLKRGESWPSVYSRLSQGAVDLSNYCYETSLAIIREREAYTILIALASISAFVSEQALGDVVGLLRNVGVREREIQLLEQLYLVERNYDGRLRIS